MNRVLLVIIIVIVLLAAYLYQNRQPGCLCGMARCCCGGVRLSHPPIGGYAGLEGFDNPDDGTDGKGTKSPGGDTDAPGEAQTDRNEIAYLTKLLMEKPGPDLVEGPRGPPGPAGPVGGAFIKQGPLRSLSATDKFVDRAFNTGTSAIAFLDAPNYTSHQTWTLQSDGQLANGFGGCLMGNTASNSVYMAPCAPTGTTPATGMTWTYDPSGRLVLSGNEAACLTVSSIAGTRPVKKITKEGKAGARAAPGGDSPPLALAECGTATTQQWSFF